MKHYPFIALAVVAVICLYFTFNLNKRVNRLEGFFGEVGPGESVPTDTATNAPAPAK